MRRLKKPLSILVAALMLVSIMVIAPVTASANEYQNSFKGRGNYIKADYIADTDGYTAHIYRIPRENLHNKIEVVRCNADGSTKHNWSNAVNTTNYNSSNLCNILTISTFTDGKMNANWDTSNYYQVNSTNDPDNIYLYVYSDIKYADDHYAGFENISYWFYTYDEMGYKYEDYYYHTIWISGKGDMVDYNNDLSDLPWKSYLSGIQKIEFTNPDPTNYTITGVGANALNGCDNLANISIPDTVTSVSPQAMSTTYLDKYKVKTLATDGEDTIKDSFSETATNMGMLGYQQKISINDENYIRYVTIVDSDLLKMAALSGGDYGFIFAKTTESAATVKSGNISKLTVSNANKLYSCKGTSNSLGNYGSTDLYASNYKYVTAAVNGFTEDATVVARFYYTLDGTNYVYAKCGTYDGCPVEYTAS